MCRQIENIPLSEVQRSRMEGYLSWPLNKFLPLWIILRIKEGPSSLPCHPSPTITFSSHALSSSRAQPEQTPCPPLLFSLCLVPRRHAAPSPDPPCLVAGQKKGEQPPAGSQLDLVGGMITRALSLWVPWLGCFFQLRKNYPPFLGIQPVAQDYGVALDRALLMSITTDLS